jgi:hypothetical protein
VTAENRKDLLYSILFLLAIPVATVVIVFVGTFLTMGFLALFGVSL